MLRFLVAVLIAACSMSAQATAKGDLKCPQGKIEPKSLGAYYAPKKGVLSVYFFNEAITDAEMDAVLAKAAKADAGKDAKGPGVGHPAHHVPYAFRTWVQVGPKGRAVTASEFAKSNPFYAYFCAYETVVRNDVKEHANKVKAAFPEFSAELKQGGKLALKTRGAYDGDPTKKQPIKATWDLQGTGTVRVYE